MSDRLFAVGIYHELFHSYLSYKNVSPIIYQSEGLTKHIMKRHPDCVQYMELIPQIISAPDYIGVNPNEKNPSFELVKCISKNIQIGIKLDTKNDYLYVATLHTITDSKLKHSIQNGRLRKFDK